MKSASGQNRSPGDSVNADGNFNKKKETRNENGISLLKREKLNKGSNERKKERKKEERKKERKK